MVFKLKMTGANCVLLCAALFSSSLTAYATEKSADSMANSSASGVVQGKIAVSGTVKDKNGEPLIGVSVVEKGTTNGMITDLDGNFGLSVSSPEAVLEFSYVGYNPVSVKVGDRTFFAIEMGESTQNLDEVVVTALGIKREKKMLGYAVQDIKADKLNTTGDPSVIGALSGKVAGLQMNTAGTGLSGSTKITLRGNSSLTDNNQPLWVVDGVPFSDNSSSDASLFGGVDRGGSTVDINPEDIESISVLKGPNAAALYGSRARNGVILITTKRGVKEKGFGVTYSGNFTWTSVASSLEQQTTYGQGKGGVFDPNVFESFGAPLDGHTYTGWLGQLGILPASYSASAKVSNLQSQNELQEEISDIRLVWDAPQSDDVDHYDIYLTRNGEKVLVGQTRNEGFYIPKFTRISGEESVEVSVVTVTKDLKESEEETLTLEYPEMTVSDVNIVASPTLVKVGEEVTLTAVANKYPDSYEWVLPTGASIVSQEGNTAKVTFSQEGSYSITVKVTNPIGVATETNTGLIEVNNTKEITNVALGKDIEDVSGEIAASGEVATNLLDGRSEGCSVHQKWCVGGAKEHWVIIDLTQSFQLYKFRIVDAQVNEGGTDNLNSYKIQLSNDLEHWSEVVNTTGRSSENYHIDWIKPTVARYIKFIPYDNDAPITIRIWEFEAYGAEGSASLSSISDQTLETNSSITVKAGYSLGGAAKEDNFNIAFVSENENIATVSDLQVSDDDTYTFTVNGGSEVGKTNITATMTNGEYQKSVSFAVTTFDTSMINLISHMSPSSAQEGTDKPTINDKGTLANLTDGNHSTAYLPDFYAAAGQSVRFVYTFDAPKSVSRFQAYFLEPDNIESALTTEVKFEVSENGTDFDVVNTAAAGTDVSYNLPEARDAKAVAFTIGLGLWMTTPIAELEVYGKDGTAIDEITVSRVLVAPNPVNQGQKMAVAADQAESIEIYSMQGALVKAERAEETITFVSTDDLTPGIYFMVVKGADYTETVKVIVK